MTETSLPPGRRDALRDALVAHAATASPATRRRRRIALVAAMLGLAGAGSAVAVELGTDFLAEQTRVDTMPWSRPEDRPQGARVEIARGPDWSFMAWRSPRGLCVAWAAGSAENWARACGRPHTSVDDGPEHLIVSLLSVSADSDGLGAVVGAVAPGVARVEVALDDGTTLSSATELAPAVTTDARFFLVRVPASPLERQFERGGPIVSPIRTYSFFAEDGRLLERYALPPRG